MMKSDYGKFVSVIVPSLEDVSDYNPLMFDGQCECCSTMMLFRVDHVKPLLDKLGVNPFDATLAWFMVEN